MTNNIYSVLGLAARARKIVTGDTLFHKIRSQEVKFVILANDASENSKKKVQDKCKFYQVDMQILGTIDELSQAIGKSNRVAIGITDHGFSKKVKEMIGGR